MDEVIQRFREQGVRLAGMPRFSLDWDFLIPPRDAANLRRQDAEFLQRLNALRGGERGAS